MAGPYFALLVVVAMLLNLMPACCSGIDRGAVVYNSNATHMSGRQLAFDFDSMGTSKQKRQTEVCEDPGYGIINAKVFWRQF